MFFFSRSQELADSLFCCPTGSVGHPVPSVFGCRTWAWTSEPQCTQRHVLPAGWRRGTFPSYSPGLWACMTNEHIKQTYRFVSLETGMNTLKASWYAAIWCNTDEIKPLWHSQNKDMVKKNKGGNWIEWTASEGSCGSGGSAGGVRCSVLHLVILKISWKY